MGLRSEAVFHISAVSNKKFGCTSVCGLCVCLVGQAAAGCVTAVGGEIPHFSSCLSMIVIGVLL